MVNYVKQHSMVFCWSMSFEKCQSRVWIFIEHCHLHSVISVMLCHSSNYTRLGRARISVSQTFLLDCFEAMWDCFTLIIIDKMPMEAFIRSWTFQVRVVFSSEVSWDNSDILSQSPAGWLRAETEGGDMKTGLRSQWRPLGPLMI